jgi:gallate decarboxylase subunit D
MGESISRFSVEEEGFLLEALLQQLGNDFLLSIWGGTAHIGAVAMAQPRPSLADPARLSATASVFCYVGHKEDDVVKDVSERLAAALGAKVVVAAGLHWDNLAVGGIEQVKKNVITLVNRIIAEREQQGHAYV